MESCIKAYEEARALLVDGNNDRITWIAAGRALAYAKELSIGVVGHHCKVLELNRLRYRRVFHGLLSREASFFYGVKDVSLPLDEAAKSSADDKFSGTTYGNVKALAEESLHAVWDAAQWPSGYTEPLVKRFTEQEKEKLYLHFEGLHDYLQHRSRVVP